MLASFLFNSVFRALVHGPMVDRLVKDNGLQIKEL